MRKSRKGSPPSAVDPSPPSPIQSKPEKKPTRAQLELLDFLIGRASCWGQLEELAGIEDRFVFWFGKTEEQAKEAIRPLVLERIMRGDFLPLDQAKLKLNPLDAVAASAVDKLAAKESEVAGG